MEPALAFWDEPWVNDSVKSEGLVAALGSLREKIACFITRETPAFFFFLLHHKSRKLFPISSESISSFSVYSRRVFLCVTVSQFIEPVPE